MKYIIYTLSMALFILTVGTVHAENSNPRIPLPLLRASSTENAMLRAVSTTSIRVMATSTTERKIDRLPIVKNPFEAMINRIDATISRLVGLTMRIDSRIAKIKAAGGNTDKADALVVKTKTDIESARTSLAALKLAAQANASSTVATPTSNKDSMTAMKKADKEVNAYILDAYTSIEKTVAALRISEKNVGIKAEVQAEATSTHN